jgi:IclR family transcriptional regulator, acetate operon repressor
MAGTARSSKPASTPARYPVESVVKAAELLKLFRDQPQLRLSDVATAIGVSPSTAHRLLTTLVESQLVVQEDQTRCYVPGPELRALAVALSPKSSPWSRWLPYLEDLSQRRGETVHLITLHDADAVFVESVEATTALRVGSRIGSSMPASCVSGGKVLLAALPDDEVMARFPSEELPTLTDSSLRTRTELLDELKSVRKRGYATNVGESEPDVSGVAVPLPDIAGREGPYVALAVAAPRSRLSSSQIKSAVADLQKTARLITDLAGV